MSTRLILASLSPRRRELLENLGVDFELAPSYIDEIVKEDLQPPEVAVDLAAQKGHAVLDSLSQLERQSARILILAADTIVVCNAKILGKPQSRQGAIEMLESLSGKTHEVFTGVVAIISESGLALETKSEVERTLVWVRSLQREEIEAYVDTGEPMDKAGSYALQGVGGAFIERIDGSFSNVIGLPLTTTVRLLRAAGWKILGC